MILTIKYYKNAATNFITIPFYSGQHFDFADFYVIDSIFNNLKTMVENFKNNRYNF